MTYTGFACADEGLHQRHGNGMLQGRLLIFHQYLTLVNFNQDSPLEVPASLRQAARYYQKRFLASRKHSNSTALAAYSTLVMVHSGAQQPRVENNCRGCILYVLLL